MFCLTKNLQQSANNLFKPRKNASGCCGEDFAPCQFVFTLATGGNTVRLTLTEDGVDRVVALPTAVSTSTAVALRKAISAAILTGGQYVECEGTGAPWRGVEVSIASTVVTVKITGDLTVKNIIYSAGTVTPTANCTEYNNCTFSLSEIGALTTPTLRVNGTDKTLITIVPGTTSAASLKTSVEAALTSPTVAGTVTVTTDGTGVTQTYTISIAGALANDTFRLVNTPFARSGCVAAWTT